MQVFVTGRPSCPKLNKNVALALSKQFTDGGNTSEGGDTEGDVGEVGVLKLPSPSHLSQVLKQTLFAGWDSPEVIVLRQILLIFHPGWSVNHEQVLVIGFVPANINRNVSVPLSLQLDSGVGGGATGAEGGVGNIGGLADFEGTVGEVVATGEGTGFVGGVGEGPGSLLSHSLQVLKQT